MRIVAKSALPNILIYSCSRLRRYPLAGPYKKVGIYKVDRFGDFVLALGAIRSVVSLFGVENCVLVASKFAKELVRMEFPNLEWVEASVNHNRLWYTQWELYKKHSHPVFRYGVEHLICLKHHRSLHDDVLIGAIPASHTWGVEGTKWNYAGQLARSRLRFDHTETEPLQRPDECAELGYHRAILSRFIGISAEQVAVTPVISGVSSTDGDFIGISPFGSNSLRDLSVEQLAAVCEAARCSLSKIVLWAEPSTEQRYINISKALSGHLNSSAVEVRVTKTLFDLLGQIASAGLVVSTETLTAHLAIALDKRSVSMLGGGHYGMFAPWFRSGRQQWVSNYMECFGCNWNCVHTKPYCISEIPSRSLARAAQAALTY